MDKQQSKPFAIGDRVISKAEGPGTVVKGISSNTAYTVFVKFDSGDVFNYTDNGCFFFNKSDSESDIRHMTPEEQKQFPKPE